MLKYETKTYKVVDYRAWDNYINKCYNKPHTFYSIVSDHELHNDSEVVILVESGTLSKWERAEVKLFEKELTSPTHCELWLTHNLCKNLCNKGLLEEGEYLINICW